MQFDGGLDGCRYRTDATCKTVANKGISFFYVVLGPYAPPHGSHNPPTTYSKSLWRVQLFIALPRMYVVIAVLRLYCILCVDRFFCVVTALSAFLRMVFILKILMLKVSCHSHKSLHLARAAYFIRPFGDSNSASLSTNGIPDRGIG